MNRVERLQALARLLSRKRFSSQEEIVAALGRSGARVTQATLSRDLRSLGVVKRPESDGGSVYELPGPAREQLDRERQSLDLEVFVNEVRRAGNLVVALTPPGHANAVGRALDLLEVPGWVGSVAGDDTVLVILSDAAAAKKLMRRLEGFRSKGGSAK